MKQELMRKIKRFCYRITPVEKYSKIIKFFYKLQVGENLDMDNPQTFNEKVQWLKLNDTRQIKTVLADKYAVREWVKDKIGEQYLIPLIGVWNSPDEIPFDSLPQRYVLKANHAVNGIHLNTIGFWGIKSIRICSPMILWKRKCMETYK